MKRKTIKFNDLPDDMLYEIAKKAALNVESVHTLPLINKSMHRVCQENNDLETLRIKTMQKHLQDKIDAIQLTALLPLIPPLDQENIIYSPESSVIFFINIGITLFIEPVGWLIYLAQALTGFIHGSYLTLKEIYINYCNNLIGLTNDCIITHNQTETNLKLQTENQLEQVNNHLLTIQMAESHPEKISLGRKQSN